MKDSGSSLLPIPTTPSFLLAVAVVHTLLYTVEPNRLTLMHLDDGISPIS